MLIKLTEKYKSKEQQRTRKGKATSKHSLKLK